MIDVCVMSAASKQKDYQRNLLSATDFGLLRENGTFIMARPSVKIDFLVSNSRRRNEGRLKNKITRLVLSLLVCQGQVTAFILLELGSDLDLDLDSTRVRVW